MLKKIIAGASLWAFPILMFAQGAGPTTQISNYLILLDRLKTVVNAIVPFVIGLAVLVIIRGVFNYVAGAGDEEKRGEAKQYIIWGIIGVFIMVSMWGLVNILVGSFALTNTPSLESTGRSAKPF